ncbi:MAG: FeoB-associated Cys-rich membrane protein [Kiritimatiellae bacterium]|nr:FeoB-associated Cys-rich membrane protein [Kiritimatiellia bacterium]
MWDMVVAVLIVGTALFFTGLSLVRSLHDDDKAGCGGGCRRCSCASACDGVSEQGKEVRCE